MRLWISCDISWESRVDRVLSALSASKFEDRFLSRDYGRGIGEFRIIVTCREPGTEFHPRRRYQPGLATFNMDVLLPFEEMRDGTMIVRQQVLARGMCSQIQDALMRRKTPIHEFDVGAFMADLQKEFAALGWLPRNTAQRRGARVRS